MVETKACWVSFLLFSLYFQLLCTFISLSTLKSRTVWANPQSSLPGRTRMKPSFELGGSSPRRMDQVWKPVCKAMLRSVLVTTALAIKGTKVFSSSPCFE